LTFKNKNKKKSQLLQKIQRSLDKIPDLATLNPLPVAAHLRGKLIFWEARYNF
jgi:hypothetical protein